jgi:MFS family permease
VTLIDPVRIQEHVHGHIGWLAAIALIHPAIVLRRTKRKAHLAVGLAAGIVTLAGGMGAYIYGDYRDRLRQSIFIHARVIGYLFERKEHLAFGAVLLAWAGTIAYVAATRFEGDARERLRKASHWAFVGAAVMAVVTAGLGTVIAAYKTF